MDKDIFEQRIKDLSDELLLGLLDKTSIQENKDIYTLALDESRRRNLNVGQAVRSEVIRYPIDFQDKKEILNRWNWAAFLLAPVWALSHKLEKWAILSLIPIVGILAAIYLGKYGNRLAYEKSNFKNIDEFIELQEYWGKWSFRMIFFGLIVSGITFIIARF